VENLQRVMCKESLEKSKKGFENRSLLGIDLKKKAKGDKWTNA
jgi:hypothetical protein